MVKNPSSNARGEGLIPGWGTKIPHATGQLSPRTETREAHTLELMLCPQATTGESPHAATKMQCSQKKTKNRYSFFLNQSLFY